MNYPETPQVDAADDYFGRKIADPYRRLENDIRRYPERLIVS